jgi:hypothetical protein
MLLAVFLALTADGQVVGGSVSGTITDRTGAALAGASVLVHNQETGNKRRIVTGQDGRYAAPSIPVRVYTVLAEQDGSTRQQREDTGLTAGRAIRWICRSASAACPSRSR